LTLRLGVIRADFWMGAPGSP